MQTMTLPQNIEDQLTDLENRHQWHRAMLDEHHRLKHERRERHREGWHRRRPNTRILK